MSRKVVSGPIRDKDRTKEKLIKTVGEIIKYKGFHELKITNIAKVAGVDKKLIYEYFGTVENLINSYLQSEDYGSSMKNIDFANIDVSDHGKGFAKILIENMFDAISKNKELQKIIVWELYEYNDILRKLADHREEVGEEIFQSVMHPYFKANHKKFRAILGILISSTYYLNIHAQSNGSKFCGLNINDPEDKNIFLEVMGDIVDNAYEKYH